VALERRIGILTGWRCWTVRPAEGLLRPIYKKGLVWKPGQALEATCPDEVHSVPAEGCKCGIWAVCHPMLLSEIHWKEHKDLTLVVGQVALWGNVLEFERGWRAQFAYPTHLYALTDDEWLAATLRERYAVPVAWGSEARPLEQILPPGLRTRRQSAASPEPLDVPSVPFALAGVAEMITGQEINRLEQLRADLKREQAQLEDEREAMILERQRHRIELQRRALELRQLRDAATQERRLLDLERTAGPPVRRDSANPVTLPPGRRELYARCRSLGIRHDDIAAEASCCRPYVSQFFAGRNSSSRLAAAIARLIEERVPGERGSRVRARLAELGWSQNELARRIERDPGLVGRVLRGEVASRPIWQQIEQALSLDGLAPANRPTIPGGGWETRRARRRQLEGLSNAPGT